MSVPKQSNSPPSFLIGLGFIALTFLVYVPALQCGFIWDDDDYVTENMTLRSVSGLRDIWIKPGATPQYYPLVHSTYWLEYQMWGLNAAGYHAVNIFLHGLNAWMLWLVLKQLQVRGAMLAAFIFAVHPVHAESVVWITERKNTLSGLMYLCSAWCFLRFYFSERPKRPWGWYVACIVCFAGALTSKTVTVTLPAALLVVMVWREKGFRVRQLWPVLPMFAVGIPMAFTTVWMETNVVGTKFVTWDLSIVDRVLIAGRAICFYFGKIVYPVGLTFIYSRWDVDAAQTWQFVFPVIVLALIAGAFLCRKKIGGGPLAAILLFAGTLSPALGFIDVYPMRFSFVADHFQYLASIMPITLLAWLATSVVDRFPWNASDKRTLVLTVAPIVLGVCGFLTWRACAKYENLEILWLDTIAKNPRSQIALSNLSKIRFDQGVMHEALDLGLRAVEADPDFGAVHNNLASVYGRLGEIDKAMHHAHRAVDLEPRNVAARLNLSQCQITLKRFGPAETHLRVALSEAPEYAMCHELLGEALLGLQRPQEAREHLERAADLGTASRRLYQLRGEAERALGNDEAAEKFFRLAQ